MLEGLLVDLVPFSQQYADLMHKWENSEASFWSDVGDWQILTRAQLKAGQERRREQRESGQRSEIQFGVQTKDGTPIGFFAAFWMLPHHGVTMVGAQLGEKEYWGGGYGTDALLLLVDYLFDWLDMRKIWLMTMSLNARVIRQMEKAGFTLEARQPASVYAAGEWYDTLAYGVFRDEWPGRDAVIARIGLEAR